MSKNLVIWLAILGLILLAIFCICTKKDNIENDIRTRSLEAIVGIDGFDGDIEINGRNITINGNAESDEVKLKISQLLGSEYGVRKIFNNLVTPTPEEVYVKKLEKIQEKFDKLIEFDNIEFENNTAIVSPESSFIIDEAVQILNEYPEISIEVGGHADAVGNIDYNLDLSQRRAEAVLYQLVNKGISRDRLTAKGYGISQSASDDNTQSGQQRNRRVEFKIVEGK